MGTLAAHYLSGPAIAVWLAKRVALRAAGKEIMWEDVSQAPQDCLRIHDSRGSGRVRLGQDLGSPPWKYARVIQKLRKNVAMVEDARLSQGYNHRFVKGLTKMLVTSACMNCSAKPEAKKIEDCMSFVSKFPKNDAEVGT